MVVLHIQPKTTSYNMKRKQIYAHPSIQKINTSQVMTHEVIITNFSECEKVRNSVKKLLHYHIFIKKTILKKL